MFDVSHTSGVSKLDKEAYKSWRKVARRSNSKTQKSHLPAPVTISISSRLIMPDRFSCKSNRPELFSLILSGSYSILVGKILRFVSSFPIVFNYSAVFVIVRVFVIFTLDGVNVFRYLTFSYKKNCSKFVIFCSLSFHFLKQKTSLCIALVAKGYQGNTEQQFVIFIQGM